MTHKAMFNHLRQSGYKPIGRGVSRKSTQFLLKTMRDLGYDAEHLDSVVYIKPGKTPDSPLSIKKLRV